MGFIDNQHVVLQHVKDKIWKVKEEFCFWSDNMGLMVIVPVGETTDHATIFPFIPDALIDNTGPISNGATPHDMYYRIFSNKGKYTFEKMHELTNGRYWSKKEVDNLFFEINACTVMPWHERLLAKTVKWNIRARRSWLTVEEWYRLEWEMESGKTEVLV